jgi:hypothetical protein
MSNSAAPKPNTDGKSKAEMKAQIDAFRNVSRLDNTYIPQINVAPLLQPKVKKDERKEFDLDTIYRRLANNRQKPYPIDLPSTIRDSPVKRLFMAQTYGGSPVNTFPRIRPELLAKHGYDDFMYLTLLYNPNAPQVPGCPGLFYECCDFLDGERAKIRRLFILLGNGWWLYVGQYSLARANSLTKEEWNSQTSTVSPASLGLKY